MTEIFPGASGTAREAPGEASSGASTRSPGRAPHSEGGGATNAAPDRGGDLTIADGNYCDRCACADALDCMAAQCDRRDLARKIAGGFASPAPIASVVKSVMFDPVASDDHIGLSVVGEHGGRGEGFVLMSRAEVRRLNHQLQRWLDWDRARQGTPRSYYMAIKDLYRPVADRKASD